MQLWVRLWVIQLLNYNYPIVSMPSPIDLDVRLYLLAHIQLGDKIRNKDYQHIDIHHVYHQLDHWIQDLPFYMLLRQEGRLYCLPSIMVDSLSLLSGMMLQVPSAHLWVTWKAMQMVCWDLM